MQLFQLWKESLVLFAPKNFKLFLLVTLNTIVQIGKALVRYCWAPLLLFFAMDLFVAEPLYGLSGTLGGAQVVLVLIRSMMLFLVFLAARPSMLRKGYWYFASYWYYWFYVALYALLRLVLQATLVSYLSEHTHFLWGIWSFIWPFFAMNLATPLYAYYILFLLDSSGSIFAACASLWRALKMMWYNLPAVFLIHAIGYVCGLLVANLISVPLHYVSRWVDYLLSVSSLSLLISLGALVFAIIWAAFVTNFYIKRLYDQCGLYFETKEKE